MNNNQIQFGGRTLEILDANAGLSGVKFLPSHLSFVTAGYDHTQFLAPLTPGDISKCTSYVTGADKKAVEVFSKFEAYNKQTKETKLAFMSFCTLIVTNPLEDVQFPKLIPETAEEVYLVKNYQERLKKRRQELQENKEVVKHLNIE
ncbi:MAG: acyl-CoA thioester hydrolase [Lentilactobacillus hilgardii]|uniref:acyl-CoA thioester hydrolase n=1 Tax=Lentilactobacillus hilgardii TaxID=1588 RepID=UPI001CC1CBEC|nr:acyl-CoA thioester hydrolase [Lentilactobacillus hilgardii]MBZ2200003.1 acyl-CoA thioester hydrolase [Lentilactobacillus hilgardii]MBZ2203123.1 acyl-CoA thioester hydrolase [Lentilactobacillus hilgardii]